MSSRSRPDLGHGPRLDDEAYDRAVVRLHSGRAPMPTADEDRALRRAELDLAIDHRLGQDFPRDRRDQLWRVMQDVERRRLRLMGRYLLGRLVFRESRPAARANRLAAWMVDRFAEVLDRRELDAFFELGGDEPALPVDRETRG